MTLLRLGTSIVGTNIEEGQSSQSEADFIAKYNIVRLTRKLKEAGELLYIQLLDHLIIGNDGYTSMKEKKLL